MPTEYLSSATVAQRTGLAIATIRSYILKGLMPEADVFITTPSGPLRGWSPETIDAWLASRPGRGARTDLTKGPGPSPTAGDRPCAKTSTAS